MKIDVVILAAGQGTRMRSSLPKVLHPLGGQSMVAHVVEAAAQLDDVSVHVVIGHGGELVRESLEQANNARHFPCNFVEQKEQKGTGHAVAQALPLLTPGSKTLILYGDVPLIQTSTLESMIDAVNCEKNIASMAVLTVELDDATGYGRIIRDEDFEVTAIVEHKDATPEQRQVNEINTGIMCIPENYLQRWLPAISNDNAQSEYYLTDVVEMAVADGVDISTPQPSSTYEVQGVNNRIQLAELERVYQFWQAERLMTEGATLADPSRIDIRGSIDIGHDVFIDVNCVFEGDVTIGNHVSIGPNCVITSSSIDEHAVIHSHSVLQQAEVGKSCQVGPYARLRPGAQLSDNAKVGNFVEVKNASLGVGAKANHLSYIGDAEIGAATNIGAGTITCNYDGANKFQTKMGSDVFIGSNSTLVAPLEIEDGGFVAAGSTVTQTVPKDNLAVGRGRQRNIEGWSKPKKSQ